MGSLLQKPLFLVFLFIFFALILNVFILSLVDNISVTNAFFTMYSFWFFMIVILIFISRTLSINNNDKENCKAQKLKFWLI